MLFYTAVLVSALVFLQAAFAAPTVRAPAALPDGFLADNLSRVASNTRRLAESIELMNERSSEELIVDNGYSAVAQFQNAINFLDVVLDNMTPSDPSFTEAEEKAVATGLKDFIQSYGDFSDVLVRKHLILAQYDLATPVPPRIKSYKEIYDRFVLFILDFTHGEDVSTVIDNGQPAFEESLRETIVTYEKSCIPAPTALYPVVQPICV